jgi:hypothetical protein
MCKKLDLSEMLTTILRNFQEKDKRKSELSKNNSLKSRDFIYNRKDNLFLAKNVKKKQIEKKNILNFHYKQIWLEKRRQNHIDTLDLSNYSKKAFNKQKKDRYTYIQSLKSLNRKEVLLEEKKIINQRQQKVLENNYNKMIDSFPLKKSIIAYNKYKRDLRKHPYKKYLKIKTTRDLINAGLLELERKNEKKGYFMVTKKMNTAFGLTRGINFLPKYKTLNKKKKVNLLDLINKSSNKAFDSMHTYLDKTFISFSLINKFKNVNEFPIK